MTAPLEYEFRNFCILNISESLLTEIYIQLIYITDINNAVLYLNFSLVKNSSLINLLCSEKLISWDLLGGTQLSYLILSQIYFAQKAHNPSIVTGI